MEVKRKRHASIQHSELGDTMSGFKRLMSMFAVAAILGFGAFAFSASPALPQQQAAAWSHPGVTAAYDCEGNVLVTVQLSDEGRNANYDYQLAWGPAGLFKQSDLNALSWKTYDGVKGDNHQTIASGTGNLYVRWVADPSSWSSTTPSAASGCSTPVPTPVPALPGHTQTCGGTVSFTDVPEGWWLVINWGNEGVVMPVYSFGSPISLAPGDYRLIWHAADESTVGIDTITIVACATPTPTPTPPAPPVTTCGGTVSFSSVPDGWWLVLSQEGTNTAGFISGPFVDLAVNPGTWDYQWYDGDPSNGGKNVQGAFGTFTISACATPVPSPTPSATPTATPVPTGTPVPTSHPTLPPTSTTGSSGSGSNPSIPLVALTSLLFGVLGLGIARRRAQQA